ncbi:MAG: dicarboxylate/amino acid:cation symporter [Deltaproteobacteria bacterium]|nr:dicarboxylate/amino acid:cation symporter [Deltaproteobacteria bacterium]
MFPYKRPHEVFPSRRRVALRSLSKLVLPLQHLVERQLWAKIVVGMVLGAGLGVLLGPSVGWIEPQTATLLGDWVALPGKIFLGMIQMIVVPLVFASIVRGLAASEGIE